MQGKRHAIGRAPALVERRAHAFVRPAPAAGPVAPSARPAAHAARPVAPAASHPAPHHLVGVSPESVLAAVERLEVRLGHRWLLWGSVRGRPIAFTVDERDGREMLAAVASGEEAVAIVEPWQMVGQSLD